MVLTFTLPSLLPAFCVSCLLYHSEPVLPSLLDAHMFSSSKYQLLFGSQWSTGEKKKAEAKYSVVVKGRWTWPWRLTSLRLQGSLFEAVSQGKLVCGGGTAGGLNVAHSRAGTRFSVNWTEQKAAPKFCSAFLWETERSEELLWKQSSFPAETPKDTSVSASGGALVRDGTGAPSSLPKFASD